MRIIEAWNLGYTGKGVVVSILVCFLSFKNNLNDKFVFKDDGVDHQHPDLAPNYVGSFNDVTPP